MICFRETVEGADEVEVTRRKGMPSTEYLLLPTLLSPPTYKSLAACIHRLASHPGIPSLRTVSRNEGYRHGWKL